MFTRNAWGMPGRDRERGSSDQHVLKTPVTGMLFSETPVSCSPGPLQDHAEGGMNRDLIESRRQRREEKASRGEARTGRWKEFPCRISVRGEEIHVTAELAGVSEEMIRIDLEGRTLIISADGKGQHYRANIVLPWEAGLKGKRFRKGTIVAVLGEDE